MRIGRQEKPPAGLSQRRVFIIAAVLGAAAILLNLLYMSDAKSEKLVVYKAGKLMKAGEVVNEDSFEKVELWGDVGRMRSVVVDSESFAAFSQQPLAETLTPGDILLTRSFLLSGQGGLRDSIGENQRALALDVADEAQAVGYFVRPGDMVDIWGVSDVAAFPIVKSVCVKAVGDAYLVPQEGGRDGRYRSVTIFVPGDDAQISDLLSNVALADDKINLALIGKCEEGKVSVSRRYVPEDLTESNGEQSSREEEP